MEEIRAKIVLDGYSEYKEQLENIKKKNEELRREVEQLNRSISETIELSNKLFTIFGGK